jgi:GDP-4-dehydro-6-deoxy-D-mannose reductase
MFAMARMGLVVHGYGGPGCVEPDFPPLDLSNGPQVSSAVASWHPDVILHFGAQSSVRDSWESPSRTIEVNTVGTLNLWTAARGQAVEHFIYVSSAEVYAPSLDPLHEDSAIGPQNPYGISKWTSEQLLSLLQRTSPVRLTILRPFNHVGPGQSHHFVVPQLVERLCRYQQVPTQAIRVGNLGVVRDFLDVRDAASAYAQAAASQTISGVFNVCSGVPRSISAVLDDLAGLAGLTAVAITEDPALMRPTDAPMLLGLAGRLSEATGWTPQIPWEQTLLDIWQDVCDGC